MIDFELWKNALLKPAPTFAKAKKGANVADGLKQLAIALLVAGVIAGIVAAIYTPLGLGGFGILFFPVLLLVTGIIGAFVLTFVVWLVAKVLGGKGAFGAQFHLAALVIAPVVVLDSLLKIVPAVGGLLGVLLSLYSLYPHVVAVREVHAISTLRAAVAVLLPLVIVLALLTVIVALALAGLGAIGLGALAGALAKNA